MLNGSRIKAHQLGDVRKLLVVIGNTFHLKLDLEIDNSLVEVFGQHPCRVLFGTVLVSTLDLLLPLDFQLLLLIVLRFCSCLTLPV